MATASAVPGSFKCFYTVYRILLLRPPLSFLERRCKEIPLTHCHKDQTSGEILNRWNVISFI